MSLSWFAFAETKVTFKRPRKRYPLYLLHMPLIILLESGLQLDTLFKEWFTFRILALFFLALFILAITNMPVVKRGSYLFNPQSIMIPRKYTNKSIGN